MKLKLQDLPINELRMKVNSLTPVLWTEKFEETIQFYTHVLKFSLKNQNSDWNWAVLEKDEIQIMISLPNSHEKKREICFSGSFYFNIENIQSFWDSLKFTAKICYELEVFDWGMREFAIYDNNGYILQFGESVQEISREE
ncbi:VOC family protein [Chryseobacterium oryzae]|uniref:VOC family protein n=1 Tax=Chryseobacterium oryzae TaxID=2929799 RepID=A0ABY4BHA8_9FLAO|nr:VOC family protein [Chryseobacterium oryzae]UOE37123.1 VOC family protein [Chryseobacterium oryzae]